VNSSRMIIILLTLILVLVSTHVIDNQITRIVVYGIPAFLVGIFWRRFE